MNRCKDTARGEDTNRGEYPNRGEYTNRGQDTNRGEYATRGPCAGLEASSVFVTCLLVLSMMVPVAFAGDPVRRLSDMGVDGDTQTEAGESAAACSAASNRCLVVWQSDEVDNTANNEEFEIFGQFVDGTGSEVGVNDFRISFQGGDGSNEDNLDPAVIWNAVRDEFLVIWEGTSGENPPFTLVQIWGQRIDGRTGAAIGGNFQISDISGSVLVREPALAHNRSSDQYFVVWTGNVADSPANELEIFGILVTGAGVVVGESQRLTHHGTDGDSLFDAEEPHLAWNSLDDEYLLVVEATQSLEAGTNAPENEIYGQRLSPSGLEIGATFRISAMGPEGDAAFNYRPRDPEVVFDPVAQQYLVVWSSADDRGTLAANELEIFGQRLSRSGAAIGEDDLRISFQGEDGDSFKDAERPTLAYSPAEGGFLVAWQAPTVEGLEELEIFAQRLSDTGALVSAPLRLSTMGPAEDNDFAALAPAVAANDFVGNFLVTWHGDDDVPPLVEDEIEIFGRVVGEPLLLIFLDGFESGSTDAWSGTVP